MNCEHYFIRTMEWPDGGDSDVCSDCLMTRHSDEVMVTEWQDHGYKHLSDWYKEAYEFQLQMEKI